MRKTRRTTFSRSAWAQSIAKLSCARARSNVSTSARKQYRVKVKNGGGQKVSRTSRINLKSPVVITANPESQLVSAGDTVSFQVAASGHGNLAYQWFKAGSALSDNGKFQGARSPQLVVQNVGAADASLYYAIVSNQDNLTARSSAAQLSVRGPVSVTVQPGDISLYAGQSGELVIGTSGDGPISFTWQKWTGSGWQNLGAPSANTLRFTDVSAAVAGRYRCVIGNSVSSAASQSATVTVLDDASRRAMAERGVDAAAYAEQRSRCFSDASVGNMPFWDAEAACAVFAQAPDLERCEIEAADRTFAMVTCSKKSRRIENRAGRVIKRAGEVAREDSKRNNAVQHTTRARETGAGSARVVHGAHDASSDLASHSRRES